MNLVKTENHRERGLDILRNLSMLMVITIHIVSHGGLGKAYAPGSVGNWLVSLIEIAAYPAVDCFVLLSGYLLSNLHFKVSRLFKAWLPAVFWSVVIQCIFFMIDRETITPGTVLYMFLPVLSGRYWFLNAYIVMILVSPVLNRLLRDLPRWQMLGFLLVLLAVFCVSPIFSLGNDIFKTQNGYAFPWFVVMYLCGGYIRNYCSKSANAWKFLCGYLLFVLSHLLWNKLTAAVIPGIGLSKLFMKYTSIPVFGSALCLLQFFRSVSFSAQDCRSRLFARVSPLVFCVYLIHDHPLIRTHLLQERFILAGQFAWWAVLLWVIGTILGTFLLGLCLEWLRTLLFKSLRIDAFVQQLCEKMTEIVVSLLKGKL